LVIVFIFRTNFFHARIIVFTGYSQFSLLVFLLGKYTVCRQRKDPIAMTNRIFRLAEATDAAALLRIYAPYALHTAISFELEPPIEQEFAARIQSYGAALPYLLCEEDGQAVAYAYAAPFHERGAYRFSVETSIYLAEDARGRGLGRALYGCLLELLYAQGYYMANAGITLPNPASVALHEALGFTECGHIQTIGYKLGGWWDVLRMQKPLRPAEDAPLPTTGIRALGADYLREVLEKHADAVRLPK
jgi:phosphinothricin acetyltransferase